MPFLTTLGLVAGAAGAAKGFIGGSKMASDARKGLQNLQFQDLSVGAFDKMKASLDVENRALERLTEQRFSLSDVASGLSGSEAMSFLSAGEEQIGAKELGLYGQMQKEEGKIDLLQAQDFQTRRQMQEQRDMQEKQSLQQQLYAGEQMQADAIKGFGELAVGAGIGEMQAKASAGQDPLGKSNKTANIKGLQGLDDASKNLLGYNLQGNSPFNKAMVNALLQGGKKKGGKGALKFLGAIPGLLGKIPGLLGL